MVALTLMLVPWLAGCPSADGPPAPDLPVGTEIGQQAPPLAGISGTASEYELSTGGTGTVVVFFRGYHCGLCRERLRELQGNLSAYQQVGARVVAATGDAPGEVQRAVQDLGLDFPVVSVDTTTLTNWGLVRNALPLPAAYLLDESGVVVYRHIGRNAGDRAHDIEILAVLQALHGRRT